MYRSIAIAAFVILSALSLLALLTLARYGVAVLRQRRDPDYVPVPDPAPPAPVRRGGAVSTVAGLCLLYVAAHLLALAYWAATGSYVPQTAATVMLGAYLGVAAVVMGIGGVLLAMGLPFGRRGVAWGGFLFGLISFMVGIAAMMLPTQAEAPPELRELADILLIVAVIHLVADTAIGAAAQRVGRGPSPQRES
jgi:hypothetical protein